MIVCVKSQSTVLISEIFPIQIKEGTHSIFTRIRVVKRAVEPFTLLRSNFLPMQQIWICWGFWLVGFGLVLFSVWCFWLVGLLGFFVCDFGFWVFWVYFHVLVFTFQTTVPTTNKAIWNVTSQQLHLVPQCTASPITAPVVLLSLLASPTQRSG